MSNWSRMVWPAFREYILPGRTPDQFDAEGKAQAAVIQQHIPPRSTVLEHGCGVGRILKHIKAKRRLGLDVSRGFLKEAAEHGITPLHYDGIHIPLPDNSVDFVYSIMVFQHLQRKDNPQQMSEIRRVLQPDGGLYLQLPKSNTYYQGDYTYTWDEVEAYARLLDARISTSDLVAYGNPTDETGKEWLLT